MRTNILIIGTIISLAAIAQILFNGVIGIFTAPVGILNLVLGVITPKPQGVSILPEKEASPRVLVDRGVHRTAIYHLAFFDTKLVMKKLASTNTTVILPIILFIAALTLEGSLIGALSGGLTGYSVQEFLTQRARDRIVKAGSFNQVKRGDLELQYEDINRVRVRTSSIYLYHHDAAIRVSLPRGYASKMRPVVAELLQDKYEEEPTPQPASS